MGFFNDKKDYCIKCKKEMVIIRSLSSFRLLDSDNIFYACINPECQNYKLLCIDIDTYKKMPEKDKTVVAKIKCSDDYKQYLISSGRKKIDDFEGEE